MFKPSNKPFFARPEFEMSAGAIGVPPKSGDMNQRRGKVVEKIRKLMADRGLVIGDRLPGERQMAADFGVSRGTIREAVQFLATMGLLEIRHGGGSYLLAMPDEMGQSQSGRSIWVRQNRGRVLEVLEVRVGAESFAAELAARRSSPEDHERLARALQAMKTSEKTLDVPAFVQSDLEFHDAIVKSVGNETLQELLKNLGEELVPERAAVAGLKDRMSTSYSEHLEIYNAIITGDGELAAAAMRRHLASIKSDILSGFLHDGEKSLSPTIVSEDKSETETDTT